MAREIQMAIWCDVCQAGGAQSEAEELPAVTIGTRASDKPKVLALCETHKAELYDPLVGVLSEHGVLAEKLGMATAEAKPVSSTDGRKFPAPDGLMYHCSEHPEYTSKLRSTVNNHRNEKHGAAADVYIIGNHELEYKCDICPEQFTSPQGLSVHKDSRHVPVEESRAVKAAQVGVAKRNAAKKASKKVLGAA